MNDLRDELSDFARHIEVPTASATDAIARARRRSQLTVVTRVGAAALLVGVGVLGVQRLSTPGLEGDPIDAPNGVASPVGSDPTPESDPGSVSDTTMEYLPSATSVPLDDQVDEWLASAPQARPAEPVDLGYNWNVYPAGSPEALPLRFDPTQKYAIATADGPDGYEVDVLYSKGANGWDEIDQFENVSGATIVGDTVFAVRWSQDDEGEPVLRKFDIPSRTWTDVAFPEGAYATLPADAGPLVQWLSDISLSSNGDSLVAVFATRIGIDLPKDDNIEVFPDRSYNNNTVEIKVVDIDCTSRADYTDGSMPYPADSIPDSPEIGGYYDECTRRADPAEFGLNDAQLQLVDSYHPTVWTLQGDSWQQADIASNEIGQLFTNGVVQVNDPSTAGTFGPASSYVRVNGDGSVTPLFDGKEFVGSSNLGEPSGFTSVGDAALVASGDYVLSQNFGSSDWLATDLGGLGDVNGWGAYEAVPNVGFVAENGTRVVVGTVYANLSTDPIELTSGDYTIRWPALLDEAPTVVNNATGETLPEWSISTESGQIELVNYDGETDSVETLASFGVDWRDVPALESKGRDVVFVSPDGVRFDAVDSDALAALVPDAPAAQLVVGHVAETDGQLVITARFIDDKGMDASQPYVFVGTPS